MKVKQWMIRTAPISLGKPSHKYLVLAPTRVLAILNLRHSGEYGSIITCGVCRNKYPQSAIVERFSDPLVQATRS